MTALVRAALAGKPILCRDREGTEHQLGVVDHPSGMVTLFGVDDMTLVLHPAAAIELGVRLIMATRTHTPGAISGAY